MTHSLAQTIITEFLALESGSGTRVDREVDILAPLFAEFPTLEKAVLELHVSVLRHASQRSVPEEFTEAAGLLFGLARALQCAQQDVPTEVVLTTVAHTMCAALTACWDPTKSRHFDLGRSWLAHAYLVAGIEAGGAR